MRGVEVLVRLRPRPFPTAVALIVAVGCVRLGVWQLHRYEESSALSERILSAWRSPALQGVDPALGAEELRYRTAVVRGRWREGSHVVVRGTPVEEKPGYQVVATLELDDGRRLLVDRGWVPMEIRASELEALAREAPSEVEGLLVPIEGSAALRPERSDDGLVRWPLEMDLLWGMFPRAIGLPFAAMAAQSGGTVVPVALRVGPALQHDSERRRGALPVAGYVLPLPQTHHLSYAAQWFAFAAMAALVWVWFSRELGEDVSNE